MNAIAANKGLEPSTSTSPLQALYRGALTTQN